MPASDFRVQNFEVIVPPGEAETDVTISLPVDPTRTRVILASPGSQMQVREFTGTLFTRDLQAGIQLIDSDTVRIHTSALKAWSGVVMFSLMEYIGAVGGVNEFTVERTEVAIPLGSNGVDLDVLGFSVEAGAEEKTTTHITGVIVIAGEDTAAEDVRISMLVTPLYERTTTYDNLTEQTLYVGTSTVGARVWLENVNWLGSNWTIGYATLGGVTAGISNVISFTVDGLVQPGKLQGIVDVGDWGSTWIEQSRGILLFTAPEVGETLSHIVAAASSSLVQAFTPVGGSTSNSASNGATIYFISNPEVKVSHQGELAAAAGEYDPLHDVSGTGTVLTVPVRDSSATIDAGNGRAFSIITGSPSVGPASEHDDQAIQLNEDGDDMTFRRSLIFSGITEYIQTIQLGLDGQVSGTIEDSVIRQPDWTVTIKNR